MSSGFGGYFRGISSIARSTDQRSERARRAGSDVSLCPVVVDELVLLQEVFLAVTRGPFLADVWQDARRSALRYGFRVAPLYPETEKVRALRDHEPRRCHRSL